MTARLRYLTRSDWRWLAVVGVCVLMAAGAAGWLAWLVVRA